MHLSNKNLSRVVIFTGIKCSVSLFIAFCADLCKENAGKGDEAGKW